MEDKQILALLNARDEAAISALSKAYGHKLQRLARNILSNEQDVQECVNDTYLALWQNNPSLLPIHLAPYLYRTCKNIAINRLRATTAQKRSGYEVAMEELEYAIGIQSLENAVSAIELGRSIEAFLATLRKENRAIFLQRYWYGCSVAEIAQQLSISENAVSIRLNRMRNQLKTHLQKEGYL